MNVSTQVKTGSQGIGLPTAKQLQQQIALKEAEKASLAGRERAAANRPQHSP